MNVKVKGINDYLYFELANDVSFCLILEELKSFLNTMPCSKNGYYPKAFFDFKSRILTDFEMNDFMAVLLEKQKVLFGGMELFSTQRTMKLIEKDVYNGEVLEVEDQDLLLIGNVHVGGIVRAKHHIYIVGKVEGTVEALSKTSSINISHAKNARICIFNRIWQDVTIFTLTLFYYKHDQIHFFDQPYIQNDSRR